MIKFAMALLAAVGAIVLSNHYLAAARETYWILPGCWWLGLITFAGVLYFWGRN